MVLGTPQCVKKLQGESKKGKAKVLCISRSPMSLELKGIYLHKKDSYHP